jgi:PD-(D/E)XK nuclease superfamily
MATLRTAAYVWATGIAKLLAGESQCVWAHWFRSHYKYQRIPADFDGEKWHIEHQALVELTVAELRSEGHSVFLEEQNWLRFERGGITLGGKPDIVAVEGNRVLVIDCKTGMQKASHVSQMMIYLAMLPYARPAWKDYAMEGIVRYRDNEVTVPLTALDDDFRTRLRSTVWLVGGPVAPARTPSEGECRFCDIQGDDCPERIEEAQVVAVTEHDLF